MSFYYPQLPLNMLRQIEQVRELMTEHQSYFTDPDCPYGSDVEGILRRWFDSAAVKRYQKNKTESERLEELEADPYTNLIEEIQRLYGLLKASKPQAGEDMIAYAKSATSLLSQLLGMEERAKNVKAVGEMQMGFLAILEQVCNHEQRQEILRRMNPDKKAVVLPEDVEAVQTVTETLEKNNG